VDRRNSPLTLIALRLCAYLLLNIAIFGLAIAFLRLMVLATGLLPWHPFEGDLLRRLQWVAMAIMAFSALASTLGSFLVMARGVYGLSRKNENGRRVGD
jgi:hypothetical protein